MSPLITNNNNDIITIVNKEPYTGIVKIINYTETIEGLTDTRFFTKRFRISYNNISWSTWFELTSTNLQNVNISPLKNLWIETEYTRVSDSSGSLTLTQFNFNFEILDAVVVNTSSELDCCTSCSSTGFSITDNCANPINLYQSVDNQIKIYKDLSMMINNLYGHCVDYYKVNPAENSKDVFLNEYSLYDGNIKSDLKVIVPRNEFPSNENVYSLFGMDFNDMFEIHIVKEHWECVFGAKTKPQKHDFLYFGIMDKMYQIESAYLEKGFMQVGVYYRVNLSKYEDKEIIKMSNELALEIDEMTIRHDELFGEELTDEYQHVSKPLQLKTLGNLDFDYLRKYKHPDLKILEESIINNWTVVAKYNYDLTKFSNNTSLIKYKVKPFISIENNYSFTCWFQLKFVKVNPRQTIISINQESSSSISLEFINPTLLTITDVISINGNAYAGLYKIKSIISPIKIEIETPFISNYTGNNSSIFIQKQNVATLLNAGHDSTNGYLINVYDHGFEYRIKDVSYFFYTVVLKRNSWYGLVINIGNQFNTVDCNVWQILTTLSSVNSSNKSNKLEKLFYQVLNYDPIETESVIEYQLVSGLIKITNLRLFNKIIEDEAQSQVLNQYTVKDNQWLEFFDNAIPSIGLTNVKIQ